MFVNSNSKIDIPKFRSPKNFCFFMVENIRRIPNFKMTILSILLPFVEDVHLSPQNYTILVEEILRTLQELRDTQEKKTLLSLFNELILMHNRKLKCMKSKTFYGYLIGVQCMIQELNFRQVALIDINGVMKSIQTKNVHRKDHNWKSMKFLDAIISYNDTDSFCELFEYNKKRLQLEL